MAHKMGAGSTKNTRDSQSQRLGVKCSELKSESRVYYCSSTGTKLNLVCK
jgi:ribosomal protein L27